MNFISYFFIMVFGVLFGYVFPDLLEELGLSKKLSHSWIAVFLLAFLSFAGFIIYPLLLFNTVAFNSVENFYKDANGVFLGLAVALLIGGAAHLAYTMFREKK